MTWQIETMTCLGTTLSDDGGNMRTWVRVPRENRVVNKGEVEAGIQVERVKSRDRYCFD
jgi:hypothetical protein